MITPAHPNERLARVEERVDHIEEEVDSISIKVHEMHEVLMQAKGVRWAVMSFSALVGFLIGVGAFLINLKGLRSIILVVVVLGLLTSALADGPPNPPHHHPPQDVQLHDSFYSTWMRPDQPKVSCCDRQDCAPVMSVRRVGNRWEAQRESDGQWMVVPPEKIEQRRDSPDGRSHLCSRGLSVYCFVAGSGT